MIKSFPLAIRDTFKSELWEFTEQFHPMPKLLNFPSYPSFCYWVAGFWCAVECVNVENMDCLSKPMWVHRQIGYSLPSGIKTIMIDNSIVDMHFAEVSLMSYRLPKASAWSLIWSPVKKPAELMLSLPSSLFHSRINLSISKSESGYSSFS